MKSIRIWLTSGATIAISGRCEISLNRYWLWIRVGHWGVGCISLRTEHIERIQVGRRFDE